MARFLNSRCNFKNGFFTCDLPEDAILLVVKVKTKTGNHTLVEDTEKQTEKFRLGKKPTKDGKSSPRRLPGVLTPRKNDNSMTSDSESCPSSTTETKYKPQFFDEPEYLSSDKENIPPTESKMQRFLIDDKKMPPVSTKASTNSPYHSMSEAIKRCDAPINMKLRSDSPYHPARNQLETCFREQNFLPTKMN